MKNVCRAWNRGWRWWHRLRAKVLHRRAGEHIEKSDGHDARLDEDELG